MNPLDVIRKNMRARMELNIRARTMLLMNNSHRRTNSPNHSQKLQRCSFFVYERKHAQQLHSCYGMAANLNCCWKPQNCACHICVYTVFDKTMCSSITSCFHISYLRVPQCLANIILHHRFDLMLLRS